jgi:hypothetical protein
MSKDVLPEIKYEKLTYQENTKYFCTFWHYFILRCLEIEWIVNPVSNVMQMWASEAEFINVRFR